MPAGRPDPKPRGRFSANDLGCALSHFHPWAKEKYRPRAMDRSICPGIFCSAGIFCTCKTNWYSLYIEVRPELEVSRGARCDSRAPPAAVRRVGARRPCWPRDAAGHGAANSAIQQTAMPQNGVLVSMREQQGSCATEGVLPVTTGPRDPWGLPAAVRRAVRRLNTGSWVAAAPGNTAIRQNGKSPERQYGGTAATIPWMAGPRS